MPIAVHTPIVTRRLFSFNPFHQFEVMAALQSQLLTGQ
jgi:hypothetical protein